MICKICGEEHHNLSNHVIKKHGESPKDYFDEYLKTYDNSHCLLCKCELTFIKLSAGYGKYCCDCGCKATANKLRNMSPETLAKRRERRIATCMEKYGCEHPMHDAEVKKKITDAAKNRTPEQQQIVHENHLKARAKLDIEQMNRRIKETKLLRYGDANYNNIEQCKETCLKKYGVDNVSKDPDICSRIFDSYYEKTGYTNPDYNPEVIKKTRRKYTYKEMNFDSSWELAYYIWLSDHKINFEFHNHHRIKYYFNGKPHYYYPDFIVENRIVEIKNPLLYRYMTEDMDSLDHAKYRCMMENDVKIITDCTEYLNYVNTTYGSDYLQQFRNV